jgi:transcriptional adapter 3
MRGLSKEPDVTIEELLERGGSASQIPSGAVLNNMRDSMTKKILDLVKSRTDDSDKLLRELQKLRSQNRHDRERARERAMDKDAEDRKHKLKKVKKREPEDERPLAVGAHGVARQDGVDVHKGEWPTASFIVRPFRRECRLCGQYWHASCSTALFLDYYAPPKAWHSVTNAPRK